jgi:hypothetical protein
MEICRSNYTILISALLTLIMGAIIAQEVTLVGEHISIPSGVLGTNRLKFPRAITVASTRNQSG